MVRPDHEMRPARSTTWLRWHCCSLAIVLAFGCGGGRNAEVDPVRPCTEADLATCDNLGRLYATGNGVERDDARAVALLTFACSQGYQRSCPMLGAMYEAGLAVPRDQAHALELYKRGCDGADGFGCLALGEWHYQQHGAAPQRRAHDLLKQACDLGQITGCVLAANGCPGTRVVGSVALFGNGPEPVDAIGRVYASLYLSIETGQPTLDVEVTRLELRDATGAKVASLASAGSLIANSKPFDGTVSGGTLQLWSSVRLDAPLAALLQQPVTAFVGEVVVSGFPMAIQGKVQSSL